MQPVRINIVTPLTPAELFFVEKCAELLHKDTIDTYRLRLNNPKTVLQELVQITALIEAGSLKEEYGKVLRDEALDLLRDEEVLNFDSVNKGFLLKTLDNNDIKNIFYISNILVSNNKDYSKKLFDKINQEITRINALTVLEITEFHILNKLIPYFLIELRNQGISKIYLNKFIRSVFFAPQANFGAAMNVIETLINRPKEKFTVYLAFKVPLSATGNLRIASTDFTHVDHNQMIIEANAVNSAFINYVQNNNRWHHYKMEIEAPDYYSAAHLVKSRMQSGLDLIFMGHSSQMISVINHCFIVGANAPAKANKSNFEYQLDGYFASDQSLYLQFLAKIDVLDRKPVDDISRGKIKAALRYLRLGTESGELENKLLNYWIAMEYLFSSFGKNEDKVARLRKYFKCIHAISYASKLFKYTHDSIRSLGLATGLTRLNNSDYSYIIDPVTLTELMGTVSTHPLIAYRAHVLASRYKDVNSIKSELNRHQYNVERNIVRIYRTRNEIVHTASYEKNILDITSHLRYYLTFIINGFIDFVINSPIDVNKDGKISIDDYFFVVSIQQESLFSDKNLNINKLLQFKNPVEYLS